MTNSAMPKKVMVVDDSATSRAFVRGALKNAGYEVVTREMAMGTIAAIMREKPDVVLMDVEMPALNGDAVVMALKGRRDMQEMRVLFYSSRPTEELQLLCDNCGADGFVRKSSDAQELVRAIGALMRSPKLLAQRAAKLNCWEFHACGREPGGANVASAGRCPAADEPSLDGVHGGHSAGRACWLPAAHYGVKTMCGSVAPDSGDCTQCSFYQSVVADEEADFVPVARLLQVFVPARPGER